MITLIFTSLFCNGLYEITQEGYIFSFIGKWLKKAPSFIYKPLVGCLPCMASFWGVWVYIAFNGFSYGQIPLIIINCISAAFLNYVFKDLSDAIQR